MYYDNGEPNIESKQIHPPSPRLLLKSHITSAPRTKLFRERSRTMNPPLHRSF